MKTTLDKKDQSIIALLRENSRLSIRDIAKKTKIKHSTVHQRLQKLIKNNIIKKFTLQVDKKALGENFTAFLLINTKSSLNKDFFNDKKIKEAFNVTGEYDLMLKITFKDLDEFSDYMSELKSNNNIEKTISIVSTQTIKEDL